jgi:uncharacterized protein (DUF2062 family)
MSDESFNPVAVAPTFNNARTLGVVVDGVLDLGLPLLVVNDGSTDETPGVLAARKGITVLTHSRNCGKAAALRSAFSAAMEMGFTHAVTLDTDGQHDPAEIPRLLGQARQSPQSLVLGLRDESAPGYPGKSRLGRRVSNLFIRMESGVRVEDSQCGMRVYPLGLVRAVKTYAGRFGFETEIVTRAAWAGCEIVEVPVACRYLPPGERVSHLRPWLDSFRAAGMHARLLARALLPWPHHPQWPLRETEVHQPKEKAARRFLHWINPVEAWRRARRDRVRRDEFAAGVATGAFIGNLPAYGVHAFIGLYAAKRLHLHPVAVVLGTQISTPPLGPILNAAAIALGHLILHGSLPSTADFDFRTIGFLGVLRRMLLEWCIGSPIIGLVCAYLTFLIFSRLLRLAVARDPITPNPPKRTPDTPESSEAHPAAPAPGHAA